MAYKAPIWEDGKSPAISAENLNNLSQAAEGAQVLYGNSTPTSSTEGAVGQFYLVVVADSDGNYPLYQCVAIANGRYTWRDTRRIPDSITSMLGISAPGTINRALNVLANVGNLHVWMKTVATKEPVPAGYTLGDETNTKLCYMYYTEGMSVSYASSVSIDDAGNVSLVSPASISLNTPWDTLVNEVAITKGKFVKFTATNSSNIATPGVYFIPTDATFTYVTSGTSANQGLYCDKAQKVNPYPITPAGTTTDYLTSTDPNAYPKQSAAGGQDAYYTLGDAVTGEFIISTLAMPTVDYKYHVSSSVVVSEDGTVHLSGDYITVNFSHGYAPTKSDFAGKFVQYYGRSSSGETDSPPDKNPPFNSTPSQIVYVPNDVNITIANPSYIDRYQPVTGHAAIPASTTITYLGQLGGGARIEVGSYVGTGTYGESNPCSITLSKDSAIVFILQNGVFKGVLSKCASDAGGYSLTATSAGSGFNYFSFLLLNVSASGNTISWYHKDQAYQLNIAGYTYTWVALAIG